MRRVVQRRMDAAKQLFRHAPDASKHVGYSLDVTRLARQLHRTEDKLERLLQEVEELREELAHRPSPNGAPGAKANNRPKRKREVS